MNAIVLCPRARITMAPLFARHGAANTTYPGTSRARRAYKALHSSTLLPQYHHVLPPPFPRAAFAVSAHRRWLLRLLSVGRATVAMCSSAAHRLARQAVAGHLDVDCTSLLHLALFSCSCHISLGVVGGPAGRTRGMSSYHSRYWVLADDCGGQCPLPSRSRPH